MGHNRNFTEMTRELVRDMPQKNRVQRRTLSLRSHHEIFRDILCLEATGQGFLGDFIQPF
jgi:hypothetical protein